MQGIANTPLLASLAQWLTWILSSQSRSYESWPCAKQADNQGMDVGLTSFY